MPRRAEAEGVRGRHTAPALLITALVIAGCGGPGGGGASGMGGGPELGTALGAPVVEVQASGTTALLQGVSVVNEEVVWISGHQGTWGRTLDGGTTWTTGVVPGADTLQFRDVHAFSADVAWLLSAGSGELSRIYHTRDGGSTWTLQWTNQEPDGFYDCMEFWDAERGVVYGDVVDAEFRILRTVDGGRHWELLAGDALPDAQPNEGGFAASGTCLVTGDNGLAWIATGNAAEARILRSDDWGARWASYDTPIPGGEGAGLFSVDFRGTQLGVAFGGSLGEPVPRAVTPPRVALSDDGGISWEATGQPGIEGAIFGGEWVPGSEPPGMVAVAPTGAAYSVDLGRTWAAVDTAAYWGLGFASASAGWLVGPRGRILKVGFHQGS